MSRRLVKNTVLSGCISKEDQLKGRPMLNVGSTIPWARSSDGMKGEKGESQLTQIHSSLLSDYHDVSCSAPPNSSHHDGLKPLKS
jgi:hypothetical protein